MDEFYLVVRRLPDWLAVPLAKMSAEDAEKIHELRFKSGAPPMATYVGRQVLLSELLGFCFSIGLTVPVLNTPLRRAQVEEIFFHLCGESVHSYEEELRQGFFTIEGGHRIGVGGKYIPAVSIKSQAVWQLQQAYSLNIRIARHKICQLPAEFSLLLATRFTGIILLGAPDSGKTTFLRSVVTQLLVQKRAVVVIDEREELAVSGADTLFGMEKGAAVQLALRTLSPEVIILDEVGTVEELIALEQGFFGGVDFIATLHAASFDEAEQKPQFQYLLSHGMLRTAALLEGRHAPGILKSVRYYKKET